MAYPPPPVVAQPVGFAMDGPAPGEGPGPVQVRNMVLDDADFVGKMSVEAFEGKFKTAVGERNMQKVIRGSQDAMRMMESEYHRIFVGTYNGERAGVVEIKFRGDKPPDSAGEAYVRYVGCWPTCRLACLECFVDHKCKQNECYIDHICCDSNFRGKGVGKVLMERAEWEARKRGCTLMTLAVAATNRARNLYERQGYVVTETHDGCCCSYCIMGIRKFYDMEKRLQ